MKFQQDSIGGSNKFAKSSWILAAILQKHAMKNKIKLALQSAGSSPYLTYTDYLSVTL